MPVFTEVADQSVLAAVFALRVSRHRCQARAVAHRASGVARGDLAGVGEDGRAGVDALLLEVAEDDAEAGLAEPCRFGELCERHLAS
jgi:hypothetical protein